MNNPDFVTCKIYVMKLDECDVFAFENIVRKRKNAKIFSFSHNVFHPFQIKFGWTCKFVAFETLWEKEKMLAISPFPTMFSILSKSSFISIFGSQFFCLQMLSIWTSLKCLCLVKSQLTLRFLQPRVRSLLKTLWKRKKMLKHLKVNIIWTIQT